MQRFSYITFVVLAAVFLTACGPTQPELVIYSGRSKALVEPVIERFEQETGVPVSVRYGETAQLAVMLAEEGAQTNADVFYAQDAGALGAVDASGLFTELPDTLLTQVPARYRSSAKTWIATSGRARTLAYAPLRVDTSALPQSIFDLTDPEYKGRVGWAPTNGSFQAHVTFLRKTVGDDSTRAWLQAMQNNNVRDYANNTAIVQAIANGEIDLGLPNHYYLHRFKDQDPVYPVEQTFFAAGDPGNLVNIAGAGVIKHSQQKQQALRLLHYMLSPQAQRYFAEEVFEYPVVKSVRAKSSLKNFQTVSALQPAIDLDRLRDLKQTLQLLREVGVL